MVWSSGLSSLGCRFIADRLAPRRCEGSAGHDHRRADGDALEEIGDVRVQHANAAIGDETADRDLVGIGLLYEEGYLEREAGKIPFHYSIKKEMEAFLQRVEKAPAT